MVGFHRLLFYHARVLRRPTFGFAWMRLRRYFVSYFTLPQPTYGCGIARYNDGPILLALVIVVVDILIVTRAIILWEPATSYNLPSSIRQDRPSQAPANMTG